MRKSPFSTFAETTARSAWECFDDVGQSLGNDEVGGRLHIGRKPLHRDAVFDGHLHAGSERVDPRAKPAAGQDRREDAMHELPQLVGGLLGVLERLRYQRRGVAGFMLQCPARHLQRDDRVNEALLSAVVQVPNHPPALFVRRHHDAGT